VARSPVYVDVVADAIAAARDRTHWRGKIHRSARRRGTSAPTGLLDFAEQRRLRDALLVEMP